MNFKCFILKLYILNKMSESILLDGINETRENPSRIMIGHKISVPGLRK